MGRLPLLNDILALGLPESVLTAALDATLRQESLTALVVALFRAQTQQGPLVIILEDAHWLDSLSWQLTLQVARALFIAHSPLLLVVVSRGLEAGSPGAEVLSALDSLGPHTSLELGALEPDDTVALAAQRLGLPPGSLPEAVAALVRERSSGNPFFAEELAYALRDQRFIRIEPADAAANAPGPVRCVVSGDIDAAGALLPATLQGLILARIDRLLPEWARRPGSGRRGKPDVRRRPARLWAIDQRQRRVGSIKTCRRCISAGSGARDCRRRYAGDVRSAVSARDRDQA